MTLYIVRHADKAAGSYVNPRLPHPDQPISRYGRKQAKALAGYFRGKKIEAIYTSEYIRSEQTIRPLAKRKKLKPIIDGRLNEIDSGDLAGMTDRQIQ